jgi:hypothetical protein
LGNDGLKRFINQKSWVNKDISPRILLGVSENEFIPLNCHHLHVGTIFQTIKLWGSLYFQHKARKKWTLKLRCFNFFLLFSRWSFTILGPCFHFILPRLWLAGLREEFNEAKDWLARIPAMLGPGARCYGFNMFASIDSTSSRHCRFLDAESELSG